MVNINLTKDDGIIKDGSLDINNPIVKSRMQRKKTEIRNFKIEYSGTYL